VKILLLPEQDFLRSDMPTGLPVLLVFLVGGMEMFRVPKALERVFGQRLTRAFQNLINRIRKGNVPVEKAMRDFVFSKEADEYIDKTITNMINEQRVGSAKSWKDMAKRRSAIGKEITEYIKNEMKGSVGRRVGELVSENSQYIKTLPSQWADYASKLAFRMTVEGKRPEEIEAELRKVIPEHMQKNLKTIARTESAKANAAIAQARAEDIGIPCYIWRTCRDERVRLSHQRMEGVVCFWNNPPSPEGQGFYHPGGTYNCRCFAEPIIDSRSLPNGVKVWQNGGIETLSKKKVMRMERDQRRMME